jgi:hypothetical protein
MSKLLDDDRIKNDCPPVGLPYRVFFDGLELKPFKLFDKDEELSEGDGDDEDDEVAIEYQTLDICFVYSLFICYLFFDLFSNLLH